MSSNFAVDAQQIADQKPITRIQKIIYGSGDWGRASFNSLRQIFYAIFLTDVVGLDPKLASFAALISILWDAVNDPLVGTLSDNIRSRWGRRRPFFLLFSVPFGFAFLLLWWAPPWENQILLMITVTLAYMISDTVQTLVTVPYLALTPEIAPGYDDRTSLTSYRMFFNLAASLTTAVAAPTIVDAAVNAGLTQQRGYILVAALFGILAVIPYMLLFFFIREKQAPPLEESDKLPLLKTIKLLWENIPFRYATGIYVINWIAFDVVAMMLPYYLLYWIARGDLLAKASIFGQKLALESASLGIILLVATLSIPIWNLVSRKFSKRASYISGMSFWIVVQILLILVQPGDFPLVLFFSFLAGFSVSTAHIMPEAIFPDVIDWDELRTQTRHEGMYYGAINFMRKLSSALAIFVSLQILGWFGYQNPPANVAVFTQSSTTLLGIRLVTGPIVVIFLLAAIITAWFYPLTRERQARIQLAIQRRKIRKERRLARD
jgi:GPH family glycoside/pentoside/hexuronide:cation symporter